MTKPIPADNQTFLTNNFFFPFMKYLAVKSVQITSTGLSKFPEICPDSGTGYSQRIRQILSGLTLGVGQKIANLVWIQTLPPLPLPRVLGSYPICQDYRSPRSLPSLAIQAQIKKVGEMCLMLLNNFRNLTENIRNRKLIVDTNGQLLDIV